MPAQPHVHVRVHEQLPAPARGLLRIRVRDAGGRPSARPGQCAKRTRKLVELCVPVSDERHGRSRRHRHDRNCCVQGAGPLGLLATAVAKISGARRVITIGAPDARLEIASEFGADEILSIERTSPEERTEHIRALTDGRGADIVMEFTGHPQAFNEGLDLIRRGGRS